MNNEGSDYNLFRGSREIDDGNNYFDIKLENFVKMGDKKSWIDVDSKLEFNIQVKIRYTRKYMPEYFVGACKCITSHKIDVMLSLLKHRPQQEFNIWNYCSSSCTIPASNCNAHAVDMLQVQTPYQ